MNRDFVEACRRGLWPIRRSENLLSLAARTVLSRRDGYSKKVIQAGMEAAAGGSPPPCEAGGKRAAMPPCGNDSAPHPHMAARGADDRAECGRARSRSPLGPAAAERPSRAANAPPPARPSPNWREQQASFSNLSESPGLPPRRPALQPHLAAESLREEGDGGDEAELADGPARGRARASASPGRSVSPLDRVLFRPAADRPEMAGGGGGGGFGPRGKRKPQSEI
jgi:hypothetical protein